MKILHAFLCMLAGVLALALTGCRFSLFGDKSAPRASVYVERQQPEYVIVREAPPPPEREYRPAPPSRKHIWIDGYWAWNGPPEK